MEHTDYGDKKNTNNGVKIMCEIHRDVLSSTNFSDWNVSLRDACTMSDAEWKMTSNTKHPQEKSPQGDTKNVTAVRSAIRSSISDVVRTRLPTGCLTQRTDYILDDLRKLLVDESDDTHRRLDGMGRSEKLKQNQIIAEYFHPHRKIRGLMFQAVFPLIENERTTIKYIVNGIENHPHLWDLSRYIPVTGLSEQISTLKDRLTEEYGTETLKNTYIPVLIPNHTPKNAYRGRGWKQKKGQGRKLDSIHDEGSHGRPEKGSGKNHGRLQKRIKNQNSTCTQCTPW